MMRKCSQLVLWQYYFASKEDFIVWMVWLPCQVETLVNQWKITLFSQSHETCCKLHAPVRKTRKQTTRWEETTKRKVKQVIISTVESSNLQSWTCWRQQVQGGWQRRWSHRSALSGRCAWSSSGSNVAAWRASHAAEMVLLSSCIKRE